MASNLFYRYFLILAMFHLKSWLGWSRSPGCHQHIEIRKLSTVYIYDDIRGLWFEASELFFLEKNSTACSVSVPLRAVSA